MKLVSVNIERAKHLERVIPFIEAEAPDVLCLQEVLEEDLPRFTRILGGRAVFAPMTMLPGMTTPTGIAIVSPHPFKEEITYYRGAAGAVPQFDDTNAETKYGSEHAMLVSADIVMDRPYRIATTHFTWTPDGTPDDHQRRDLAALMPILESKGALAFCGDFNAPRGGEIFSALSARWRDNIPAAYEWNLDLSLHRIGERMKDEAKKAGHDGFMVDGLFTTPSYVASDVKLIPGVSDHMAIVASISREPSVLE